MKITEFDEKRNTLYILTDVIMCDTKGLSMKEKSKAIQDYFNLSYEERINRSQYKDEILKEIKKHPNCQISEYSYL